MLKLERTPGMHRTYAFNQQDDHPIDLNSGLHQAFELLKNNDLNQAENMLQMLIVQYPKESEPRLLLGSTYYRQGRYMQAEQTFQQLLLYHPESAAGYNNLCETLIKLQRFDEAQRAILAAVKLAPDNTSILLTAANLHALRREDAAAINFLQRALSQGEKVENILRYRELMQLLERPEFQKYYQQMSNQPAK